MELGDDFSPEDRDTVEMIANAIEISIEPRFTDSLSQRRIKKICFNENDINTLDIIETIKFLILSGYSQDVLQVFLVQFKMRLEVNLPNIIWDQLSEVFFKAALNMCTPEKNHHKLRILDMLEIIENAYEESAC